MMSDPNSLQVVARVPSDIEAALIAAALGDAGIEAETTGSLTAGFRAEAPGDVSVLVRQEDLAQAKQVLANVKQSNAEIDWSQVDVGRPED